MWGWRRDGALAGAFTIHPIAIIVAVLARGTSFKLVTVFRVAAANVGVTGAFSNKRGERRGRGLLGAAVLGTDVVNWIKVDVAVTASSAIESCSTVFVLRALRVSLAKVTDTSNLLNGHGDQQRKKKYAVSVKSRRNHIQHVWSTTRLNVVFASAVLSCAETNKPFLAKSRIPSEIFQRFV